MTWLRAARRAYTAALRLDALGPIILNRDGSTSRIANWPQMTEAEQKVTMRVVAKRNKKRQEELNAAAALSAAPTPQVWF